MFDSPPQNTNLTSFAMTSQRQVKHITLVTLIVISTVEVQTLKIDNDNIIVITNHTLSLCRESISTTKHLYLNVKTTS